MDKRNYGIDFLRITSMYLVVILHILGQGGVLAASSGSYRNYCTAWFLEITAYCSVNLFALISGYVMCNSKAKLSRIADLWLQTAFYTISLSALFFYLYPDTLTVRGVLNAIFPITSRHYWYITSYFGLYIFIPIINIALQKIDLKVLKNTLIILFFAFSVLPSLLVTDPYALGRGYSLIWLIILYLAGAYIRKSDLINKLNGMLCFVLFFVCVLFTLVSKLALEKILPLYPGTIFHSHIFISYVSPTIILSAFFLFVAFAKLKFPKPIQKVIAVISPASLGVYLIHVSTPVWNYIMKNLCVKLAEYDFWLMALYVLLAAAVIYIICTIIELVRINLFKLIRVHYLTAKLDRIN